MAEKPPSEDQIAGKAVRSRTGSREREKKSPTPLLDAIRRRSFLMSPRDIFNGPDLEDMYSLPRRKIPQLILFPDTQFQSPVPEYNDGRDEVEKLESVTLADEPIHSFIRHILIIDNSRPRHSVYDTWSRALIPTIIHRLDQDVEPFIRQLYPNEDDQQKWLNLVHQAAGNILDRYAENSIFQITTEEAQALYQIARKGYPRFIGFALKFDEKNKHSGQPGQIDIRFKEDISQDLLSNIENRNSFIDKQLSAASRANPQLLPEILVYSLLHAQSQEQLESVAQRMSQQIGLAETREILRNYTRDNEGFRPTLEKVFLYLGIDRGEQIAISLEKDVYNYFDISHYEPNAQMLEFERKLLARHVKGKKIMVDFGTGTGRIMGALAATRALKRAKIYGLDFVKKHIEFTKHHTIGTDSFVADWRHTPITTKSVDAITLLGRSFTHNVTIPDARLSLREIRRVLKDDGIAIIDIPDATRGEFPELIERTLQHSYEKGITNVLPGLINDSPDKKHFFDRFAPDLDQFTALALLEGLNVEVIGTRWYRSGETGRRNRNLYLKLTKINNIWSDRNEEFLLACVRKSYY